MSHTFNKELQNFVRKNEFPSVEVVTNKIEFMFSCHPDKRVRNLWEYQVFPEFGYFSYENIKKIYESSFDPEVVKECGREINRRAHGYMLVMVAAYRVLLMIATNIFEIRDVQHPLYQSIKAIEFQWDGIGDWRA